MTIKTTRELPSSVLGMKESDGARTELLVAIDKPGEAFHAAFDDPRYEDLLRSDVYRHFDDPRNAARALGVASYNRLTRRRETSGRVHGFVIRAEQALRRTIEPGTRQAIKQGIIKR